jgi:hypothetical protein
MTLSRLTAVTQAGYVQKNGGYAKLSLPPPELGDSLPGFRTEIRTVDPEYTRELGTVDGKRTGGGAGCHPARPMKESLPRIAGQRAGATLLNSSTQ